MILSRTNRTASRSFGVDSNDVVRFSLTRLPPWLPMNSIMVQISPSYCLNCPE